VGPLTFPFIPGIFSRPLAGPFAQTVECRALSISIDGFDVGHKPRYRLAMPGEHNLRAALDAVEKSPERVLSLKSANYRIGR
jgi:hypothetical protein